MRAAVFEKAGQPLTIQEVPVPEPGPGEMLIKVKHCGICGTDLHLTDAASCFNPPAGAIMGHEFCGEIVALGAGTVSRWKEGQRVTALPYIGCGTCVQCLAGDPIWCAQVRSKPSGGSSGGFAEYTVVGAAETLALPDALSWEEGAFVEPVAVGVHAVRLAAMTPGTDVLIIGAGPVGLAVAACARALGAGRIVVTARSDSRADLARQMGASDFLINDARLAENYARITGGPPQLIFECVGLPGMLDLCVGLAAPRSLVVMMGASLQTESLLPITATMKELRLQYAVCYSRHDFATAIGMMARGQVDPILMLRETVTMDAFPAALEALRSGAKKGKVLMSPAG